MPSNSNPSRQKADKNGLAILRRWGSEPPPDRETRMNDEDDICYRFNLNVPNIRRQALTGIDPTRLPLV